MTTDPGHEFEDELEQLERDSIQVTFTALGTYTYICALHDDQGMVGSITVPPK